MKKILITGITGFAGKYLAQLVLSSSGSEIHGTYHSEEGLARFDEDLKRRILFHKVDLTNKDEVDTLIREAAPDEIYNLAAQTSPSDSLKDPASTLQTNINSQLYLLEAIKQFSQKARLLSIGSGDMYGAVSAADVPIKESTPFRPTTPYAVSKVTQDYLSLQYFLAHEVAVIRARPFNHFGPGQQAKFVVPMFAKQIAEIEKGSKEPRMKVGNLKARKDFTDVRDIVRAYVLLMEKGVPGEAYNIGSGKSAEIQEILDILRSFSKEDIQVERDQELYRPIDATDIICDSNKLTSLTGWAPEISLETTLEDTLNYWRGIV